MPNYLPARVQFTGTDGRLTLPAARQLEALFRDLFNQLASINTLIGNVATLNDQAAEIQAAVAIIPALVPDVMQQQDWHYP